ncbi:MAG: 3-methyl-2-oxobutanoate hydroxymethyltransferase [Pseudomonadota bacterium]
MNAPISIARLKKMKAEGQKIAVLTAYDASFAQILAQAGVEVLLVGDSLGMVIQGRDTTLPVSVDEMVYHCASVRRGAGTALVVVDMPFMSYNSPQEGLHNAGRLMKEGGAHMVKLEGGAMVLETVALMSRYGIPVCAHLGLLPQSVHKLGGYRVQGREQDEAAAILADAKALEAAGADMLVLECVPANLAGDISRALKIPVIGIGAGVQCDGQVLVLYDMLGITPGKRPKFSKDFLAEAGNIPGAITAYVTAVKGGQFPGPEHSF